jgi:hypothetical protein
LYFVGTGGQYAFVDQAEARNCSAFFCDTLELVSESNIRRMECLQRHGLHHSQTALYDLVERMLRPIPGVLGLVTEKALSRGLPGVQAWSHTKVPSSHPMAPVMKSRLSLMDLRCHPFLWSMGDRKSILLKFADSAGRAQAGFETATRGFMTNLDRYATKYVFGEDLHPRKDGGNGSGNGNGNGEKGGKSNKNDRFATRQSKESAVDDEVVTPGDWFSKFPPHFLTHVPDTLYTADVRASAKALLAVCKYQLSATEMGGLHRAVWSDQSTAQATVSYISVIDRSFPRMLVFLYELGIHYGKWSHDGAGVRYVWIQNNQMQQSGGQGQGQGHAQGTGGGKQK